MLLLIEFRVEIKLYPICHIQPDNTALHRAAGHGRLDAEAETATVQLLLGTVWERREKRERMKEKDGYNKKTESGNDEWKNWNCRSRYFELR